MRRSPFVKSVPALLAMLFAPAFVQAHPLADKIPKDAMVYLGWEGTTALGTSYDNSNLKGVVDAMNLQQLLGDVMAKGMKDAAAKGNADDAKLFSDVMAAVIKSPTAVYLQSVDVADPRHPIPNLAIISQVGKDADDLSKRLQLVMDKNHKDSDPPAAIKVVGDFLVLTVGSPTDLAPYLAGKDPAKALSADKAFIEASKQVAPDSALTVYFSGEAAMQTMADAAKNGPQRGPRFEQIMSALGLDAVKHGILTGGFDGKNWSTQAFLELGKDRTGLVAFMDNKPLNPDALKAIPKDVAWASIGRFDGMRLLGDLRNAAAIIDPQNGPRQMDFALLTGGNALGIDIEKDILQNHSDVWTIYGNPDAAGNSVRGMTLINPVKDEKIATQTFETLEDNINAAIAQRGGPDAKQFAPVKKGDLTLHTIELPKIAPTWTVAAGKLIIAVTPATAESAAAFDGKETLADNAEFQTLIKKLGMEKYSSFSFTDLAKASPDAYEFWTKILTAANAQAKEGDPTFTLPPLDKIKPFLAPSLDVFWSDAEGIHMKSSEPFPAAAYFGGGSMSFESLFLPMIEQNMKDKAAGPARRGPVDNGGK